MTAQTKLFMAKGINWRETTALMVTPHVEPDLYGIPRVSVNTPLIPKPRNQDTFSHFMFSATETRLAQSGFISFGGVVHADNFEIWNPRLYMACELAQCSEDHDQTTGHCAGSSKSTGTIRGLYGELRCAELFPNRLQPEKFANRDVAKFFVNELVLKNKSIAYDEFSLGDRVDEVLATYNDDNRPFVIMGWVKAPFEEDGHQVVRELHVSRFHPADYHVYETGKYGDADPEPHPSSTPEFGDPNISKTRDAHPTRQSDTMQTDAAVKAAATAARDATKAEQAQKTRVRTVAAANAAKRAAAAQLLARKKKLAAKEALQKKAAEQETVNKKITKKSKKPSQKAITPSEKKSPNKNLASKTDRKVKKVQSIAATKRIHQTAADLEKSRSVQIQNDDIDIPEAPNPDDSVIAGKFSENSHLSPLHSSNPDTGTMDINSPARSERYDSTLENMVQDIFGQENTH